MALLNDKADDPWFLLGRPDNTSEQLACAMPQQLRGQSS